MRRSGQRVRGRGWTKMKSAHIGVETRPGLIERYLLEFGNRDYHQGLYKLTIITKAEGVRGRAW